MIDTARFADLAQFAHLEVTSRDLEPWALLLAQLAQDLALPDEERLWLIKLYNAYDSFSSAWQVYRRWPTPHVWATASDKAQAAQYACTQERRGLRGGKVVWHLQSYADCLGPRSQRQWLRQCFPGFADLMYYVRQVWGVGRQTAFEWVEFLAKAGEIPVHAPDAYLWESEGPRRSLQALYANPHPTPAALAAYGQEARQLLASAGVALAWEDFETVICDFHVMRLGRYYPGRHLAALREELAAAPPADQPVLLAAWHACIPPPWAQIAPGIDKALLPVYRNTGQIVRLDQQWEVAHV